MMILLNKCDGFLTHSSKAKCVCCLVCVLIAICNVQIMHARVDFADITISNKYARMTMYKEDSLNIANYLKFKALILILFDHT